MEKFFALLASLALTSASFGAADILIDDFESGSYSPKWKVEGEAFADAPAKGGFKYQQPVSGYSGNFLVNSYFNKDDTTGKLSSVPFKIERPYLDALVGGGDRRDAAFLRVMVDGVEVGRLTGVNNERLEPKSIDLRNYLGKTAIIEIVDNAKGGWGHINVDDIVLTENPKGIIKKTVLEIPNAKKYLNIPINNNSIERFVRVSDASNKKVLLNAKMRVDFKNPQWYYSMETLELQGEVLRVELLSGISEKVEFKTEDKYWSETFPDELLRPQYHFSAPQGWLNDPNGLVFWKGDWHMYYQLSPFAYHSREKYWGHAVSKDLMTWRHLPVGINARYYENGGNNAIWSGTGFVDLKNKSGFFDKNGGIILAYTLIGKGDYVAYTSDSQNITTLPNPISTVHGRDPCIFYHEPTKRWVVLRYEVVKPDENAVGAKKFVFYFSKDLKTWQRGQELDDFYECPYIISMPVNGNPKNKKYLIFDARGECVVGDFDGEKFTRLGDERCAKFVVGNAYAGQVFNNAPNGRVINISWINASAEDFGKTGMCFSQIMSLPMDLRLVEKSGKYAIYASLSREVEKIYKKEKRLKNIKCDEPNSFGMFPSSVMVEADLNVRNADGFKFQIGAAVVEFSKHENAYSITALPKEERPVATRNLHWENRKFQMDEKVGDNMNVKIFADRCSLEIFHDNKRVISLHMPFGKDNVLICLQGNGLVAKDLAIREMKKIYSKSSLKELI